MSVTLRNISIALATCWLSAAGAQQVQIAQLRSMSLADMLQVEIGTGTSKLIHQSPGVAYVITADDIARMGARNMQEVLESIPGINIYLYQGLVNSRLVDLRGLVSERGGYVLFLRDGRPLRLLSNSTMPEIFRLPLAFVERIEVLRGPASSAYGSDALAGAVNIITRAQPEQVGLRSGFEKDRAGWGGLSGNWGVVDYSAAVSRAQNDDALVTRRRLPSRILNQQIAQDYTDIDLKLRGGGFKVDLWALNTFKEETGDPANPRGRSDVYTWHRHAAIGFEHSFTPTTAFTSELFHTSFRGARHAVLLLNVPTDGDNGEENTITNFTLTETGFSNHRLRLTLGTVHERRANFFTPQPPAPGAPAAPPPLPAGPSSRDNYALSLTDEFAFWPDWEITTGVRVDHYQDIGRVTTPRVGLVWSPTPQLSAKLLQSSGFRAPGPATGNNTSTLVESIKNTELVFDYRPNERWRAVVNAYRYRASNLIVTGAPGGVPVTRDGSGAELEITWLTTPTVKFEATVSLLSTHDARTGVRVPYTPKTNAKLVANWRAREDWTLQMRWQGYVDRVRPATDPRPPLADFQIMDVTVRHEINRNWSALFAVHNALNTRTYIPVLFGSNNDDYQTPSRNLSLQVEVRF